MRTQKSILFQKNKKVFEIVENTEKSINIAYLIKNKNSLKLILKGYFFINISIKK